VKGGERSTEEVFPNYGLVLHSTKWPSIDNGQKDVQLVAVEDMPPQRAAACLAKLVRWARYEPAGDISVIDDIDMREEEARSSVLGRHLAARALCLSEPMLHALFGEVGQGEPVDVRMVAGELVVLMGEEYPQWPLRERVDLAYLLAEGLDRAFVIKGRSKDG
jgi:hypothetical protein